MSKEFEEYNILKALNTIKKICNKNKQCNNCPLVGYNKNEGEYCNIVRTEPCDWKLKDSIEPWKAFKGE